MQNMNRIFQTRLEINVLTTLVGHIHIILLKVQILQNIADKTVVADQRETHDDGGDGGGGAGGVERGAGSTCDSSDWL